MAERIKSLLTSERRLLPDIFNELRSPLASLNFAAEHVKRDHGDEAVVRLKEMPRQQNLWVHSGSGKLPSV